MLEAARVSGTGQVPCAGIHAEFQAFGMDIVRHCLHAVGKLLRIRHQAALPVPLLQRPAVIDDQVLVALLRQPLLHHGIRGLEDQLLVDVLPKGVPGIPSHGRCQFHHIDCPPSVLTSFPLRQPPDSAVSQKPMPGFSINPFPLYGKGKAKIKYPAASTAAWLIARGNIVPIGASR